MEAPIERTGHEKHHKAFEFCFFPLFQGRVGYVATKFESINEIYHESINQGTVNTREKTIVKKVN